MVKWQIMGQNAGKPKVWLWNLLPDPRYIMLMIEDELGELYGITFTGAPTHGLHLHGMRSDAMNDEHTWLRLD